MDGSPVEGAAVKLPWLVGLRIRKIPTREEVELTQDLGGGNWVGRGPNGEMVSLTRNDEWEPHGKQKDSYWQEVWSPGEVAERSRP